MKGSLQTERGNLFLRKRLMRGLTEGLEAGGDRLLLKISRKKDIRITISSRWSLISKMKKYSVEMDALKLLSTLEENDKT